MKKPSPRNVAAMTEVFEESFKCKSIGSVVDDPMASILFPATVKIPKDMGEMRDELRSLGYLLFYSNIIYKENEVLSINISKI